MNLVPGTPQEAGMSPSRVRYVAELAARWVAQGITPSLVILVARRGVVVLHEAFGRMGPEEDAAPLRRDTLYPVASITKPVTATAAMILVEEGRLGLNRPVAWYLPEFAGEGKEEVMVHHLLTHTSGLDDERTHGYDPAAFADKKRMVSIPPCEETQHPTIHEYLSLRYDVPLSRPPGTEMAYCSYGYELLGEIVRRVSGQSLAGFCRERIFEPLGMRDTTYGVPTSIRHRVVRRAPDAPGADYFELLKSVETPWAAGGLYTTAHDIATFGQMYLNRGAYGEARILSPASVAAITRNQIPGISAHFLDQFFPEASWGLGWSVDGNKKGTAWEGMLQSPQSFSHGGAGGTLLWVDPTYELVGVCFSVFSDRDIPHTAQLSKDSRVLLIARMDLFRNAVTAAVVDL